MALVLLVGIIIIAYMIVQRPDGVLTVVYERRGVLGSASPIGSSSVPQAKPDVRRRLSELDALHAEGLLTDVEYAAKRAEILSSL